MIKNKNMSTETKEQVKPKIYVWVKTERAGDTVTVEGTVMPRVTGTGNILLESPVPREKIMEVHLNNEELRVDGPFVMAFWGDLSFTTEKVSKGLMSSAASGEGYVNVYKGTGTLWINMEEAGCI